MTLFTILLVFAFGYFVGHWVGHGVGVDEGHRRGVSDAENIVKLYFVRQGRITNPTRTRAWWQRLHSPS